MARGLVVGIYPGADPSAIQCALSSTSVDLSKVRVLLKAAAGVNVPDDDETELTFEDVMLDMEDNSFADDMTKGTGIMSDSGGTSVPGIGGPNQSLESFVSRSAGHSYVGALAIPDDEASNFNEAIDAGRATG